MKMKPVHPGAILREDVLPEFGLSVSAAAKRLGVSREMLNRIVNEKASVSPAMALRLGKFCGNGPELWINMQTAHDLYMAEAAMKNDLQKIQPPAAA